MRSRRFEWYFCSAKELFGRERGLPQALAPTCTTFLFYITFLISSIASADEEQDASDPCNSEIPLTDVDEDGIPPETAQRNRLALMLQQLDSCVHSGATSSSSQTPSGGDSGSVTGSQQRHGHGEGSVTARNTNSSAQSISSASPANLIPANTNPANTPQNQPSSAPDATNNPTKQVTNNQQININMSPFGNQTDNRSPSAGNLIMSVASEVLKQTVLGVPQIDISQGVRDGDIVLDSYAQTLYDAYEAEQDPSKKAALLEALNDYIANENQ